MTRFASLSIASIVSIAILTAAPAFAEPQSVQILSVQSDDAVDQAQALTLALRAAAKRQILVELVPGDYSLEVLSLALGCPDTPDDACLSRIAGKIRADAFVWGTLQKDAGELDLKLNFYQRGQASRTAEVRYDAGKVDDAALHDIADRALAKLLSSEVEEVRGKLDLSADELNGRIVVDGAPAGDLRDGHAELDLEVGEHDVSVRVDGYRDAEGSVTIAQGKRALLRLHPEKIGTTRAAHDAGDTTAAQSESNANAGWGALIVGGAFTALGVYSTLRVNSINHDSDFDSYRAGISKNDDACVEANRDFAVRGATSPSRISDLCSESKTFEALQYVFFGLGVVAAGTGVLILVTDNNAPRPKANPDARRTAHEREAAIHPSLNVGPHSAAIDLRFRF